MSQFNAQKNPPWARPNEFGSVQQQPQQLLNPSVMQYPQQAVANTQQASVYQAQLAMQQQALSMQQFVANSAQQMYNPTVSGLTQSNVARAVNPVGILPTSTVMMPQATVLPQQQPSQQQNSSSSGSSPSKQRVFTGTVTKVVDTYGFVDEDVFFQMSCVKGPHPVLHDRVLVEAVCLPTMPFKWNATRVQVLPMNEGGTNRKHPSSSREERNSYSAVPPPAEDYEPRRERDRPRDRSRERSQDQEERRRRRERREREERDRDRDKESRARSRSRSRSPRRSRAAAAPARKYRVRIPEFSLDVGQFSVNGIKSRYASMYIPSDFFSATARWTENFLQNRPLSLAGPSRFHVMDKDVDPVFQRDDVVEPPDADFLFSAKVMLISVPTKEELLKRCVQLAEDKESSRLSHPARLIDCLVGVNTRSKNEYMAIGGPWSPSLDGADPLGNPQVLIKTAIRTCRALAGIDLSAVTKWYRFAELHYHRAKTTYKSREVPSRVETVVIYAPDVWSVMPSALEWDGLHLNYQRALDKKLAELGGEQEPETSFDDDKDSEAYVEVKEPTHWSRLDLKIIKVNELREELVARNLNPKGLRLQLIARLSKVLKQEQEAEEEKSKNPADVESDEKKSEDDKKTKDREEKDKEKDSKEKGKEREKLLEKYKLPETPHIIVHPCKKAKSGKFNCKVVCLSLLLDYTQDINKEHTFEVSLFAENLNEMLMRDFGLQIYKALTIVPDKVEDKKDDKEKRDEKVEEKKTEGEDGEESKDASEKINGKDEDDEERRKRKRNGKKRERTPLRTINPDLLLAFAYFDTTNYGKIASNDMEELLQTLGLQLARSQIKKLVSKLASDSYVDYRKLTDTPIKSEETEGEDGEVEKTLAELVLSANMEVTADLGNKPLLPSFNLTTSENKEAVTPPAKRTRRSAAAEKTEPPEEGLVMHRGTLVNVENLQALLNKNEEARLKAEEKSLDLRHDLDDVKNKLELMAKQLKETRRELTASQKKLQGVNDRLERELISSDIYLTTLMDIQERIMPVLDTDEIKGLVNKRQQLLGAPQINLVPLTKLEDITTDDIDMKDVKDLTVKEEIKQ